MHVQWTAYYNSTNTLGLDDGQQSLINRLHVYGYTRARMSLPDAISIKPFQQYLSETFPEDGERSTSGVVSVRLDCQRLLKDPHGAC